MKRRVIDLCFFTIDFKRGLYLLLTGFLLLSGCSSTKYLKDGETFYNGAEIEFDTEGRRIGRKKILEKELKEYIAVKPNAKFLGSRPGVWFLFQTRQSK